MQFLRLATSLVVASATLADPSTAPAQSDQDIIVTAPRHRERDAATGAPIETVTASRAVRTSDLDLRSEAGMREAERRIRDAAVRACHWLQEMHPLDDNEGPPCVPAAVDQAMARLRTSLAAASPS